jgi:histidine kinase-like protein
VSGAAGTATGYTGTFHGRAEEAGRVRREITGYLGDCPVTCDLVLIAAELAANAVLHTQSRGQFFRVRCELAASSARIEVEDLGGPWRARKHDDRPHGLDVVEALTGPGGWGSEVTADQSRVVWAQLAW